MIALLIIITVVLLGILFALMLIGTKLDDAALMIRSGIETLARGREKDSG